VGSDRVGRPDDQSVAAQDLLPVVLERQGRMDKPADGQLHKPRREKNLQASRRVYRQTSLRPFPRRSFSGCQKSPRGEERLDGLAPVAGATSSLRDQTRRTRGPVGLQQPEHLTAFEPQQLRRRLRRQPSLTRTSSFAIAARRRRCPASAHGRPC
jgi:hypothetical protein